MPEQEESLQQLIDRLPDLVAHFYNDAPAPHFSRAGTGKTAPFIPPTFTNWRDEQRSWAETAAHAVPGTEVLITWGEPDGGSRKPQVERHEQTTIRATVAPAPFTPAVRERFRESVGGR